MGEVMDAYEKVQALKKKFPDETITALIKKAGANAATYYGQKLKHEKGTPGKRAYKKRSYMQIEAAPTPSNLTVLIGTPDQIRQALGGLV